MHRTIGSVLILAAFVCLSAIAIHEARTINQLRLTIQAMKEPQDVVNCSDEIKPWRLRDGSLVGSLQDVTAPTNRNLYVKVRETPLGESAMCFDGNAGTWDRCRGQKDK